VTVSHDGAATAPSERKASFTQAGEGGRDLMVYSPRSP